MCLQSVPRPQGIRTFPMQAFPLTCISAYQTRIGVVTSHLFIFLPQMLRSKMPSTCSWATLCRHLGIQSSGNWRQMCTCIQQVCMCAGCAICRLANTQQSAHRHVPTACSMKGQRGHAPRLCTAQHALYVWGSMLQTSVLAGSWD